MFTLFKAQFFSVCLKLICKPRRSNIHLIDAIAIVVALRLGLFLYWVLSYSYDECCKKNSMFILLYVCTRGV